MVREFDLPWPPSVNHYYRHVGLRVLISREGHQYRKTVMAMFRDKPQPPLVGPIKFYAEFHPPDHRRRDLDNLLKCTQDTLQHAGVYADDAQITELHIFKKDPIPRNGMVHIRIESCNDETK